MLNAHPEVSRLRSNRGFNFRFVLFLLFLQTVTNLFCFAEIVPDSDLRHDIGHHSDYYFNI